MRHKYFDTVIHTFLSALHGITQHYDSVLVCNAANAPFCPMLRLARTPVAINVNGLDYKRKKWSRLGRSYYLLSERLAALLPNEIVTDARVIQDYYASRYGAPSKMIAYGAEVERHQDRNAIRHWDVEPNRYVLYVSRLEPENNAHLVIEAFKRVQTYHKLLIVGGARLTLRNTFGNCTRLLTTTTHYLCRFRVRRCISLVATERLLLRACHGGRRNTSGAARGNGLWKLCANS